MNQPAHPTRVLRQIAGIFAACLLLAGCHAPSLLITPVSGRRALVETQLMRESLFARDKIALIEVSGLILNSPVPQLLGTGEHPVSTLLEQLDKARRDPAVKGVILRINSPGGSVVASELMHAEIEHFKKSGKPIVAIMMDVAASGGYYIACACDEIIAQPSTITGSIGVIMQLFSFAGTMEMIGVTNNAITSGEHKDSGSPFKAMREEERALFQVIVQEMYDGFVGVVASGRPALSENEVRKLADGRVYTGKQAKQVGLVDRLAGMRETVELMKERIGAKQIRLVTYRRAAEYKPNYYSRAPAARGGDINLVNVDVGDALQPRSPRFMYLWTAGN